MSTQEHTDPTPVVSLNGIPRGLCNGHSVEEGWVQYLVPKSGKYSDYSVDDAPLEKRRYFGVVKVLGYLRGPEVTPDPELKNIYDGLPENTPLLPEEAYEVVE